MSESHIVFGGLVKVRHWMEACLEALESATPADEGFRAAWKCLEDEFADLGPVDQLQGRVARDEVGQLRGKLEEMTRLHAVLATVVGQRRDEIGEALQTTRDLRKRLSFYGDAPSDVCDVQG
ncbi:MAG: hypothetical protein ACI8QZ_000021 [Chlamydiales bacterium]|jgi:hypothetical protein